MRRRRVTVLLAGLTIALFSTLLQAPGAGAGLPALRLATLRPTILRPTEPSDAQLGAVNQEVRERAVAVGRLAAQVASKDAQISALRDAAELAIEQDNKARADLAAVTANQRVTAAAAVWAQRAVDAAYATARTFVHASYLVGTAMTSYAMLLSAQGPSEFLQQADYLRFSAQHQLDVLGQVNRAKVTKANASSTARAAVLARQDAASQANRVRLAAVRRVVDSQTQLVALQAQKTALQTRLDQAQIAAYGLAAERGRYQAWQREQAAVAAREQAQQATLRDQASDSTGGWTGGLDGRWTEAKGGYVAHAALRWLGLPYAWGGGDTQGPTFGVSGPGDGWDDSAVYGFDCTGLTLWAWAQVGIVLPHYSGYQYVQGSHPSPGQLLPGDLVFWSYDGTAAGIHHVAIYLGGGQVVQAPNSGDVVKVSPLWLSGYFGATRPGT